MKRTGELVKNQLIAIGDHRIIKNSFKRNSASDHEVFFFFFFFLIKGYKLSTKDWLNASCLLQPSFTSQTIIISE